MFNRAVVPIIIEMDRPMFSGLKDKLSTLNFPIQQEIEGFGMIATLARPEHIKQLAQEESVLAIHYDMPKFALIRIPLTDIQIPSPLPKGFTNPMQMFKNVPILPSLGKQKAQDQLRDKFNSTFETRKQLGADLANDEGITGKGVNLATLDTGIDPSHQQVNFDVTVKTTIPGQLVDLNGHGTHCLTTNSGKYAKHLLNGIEVMGVAHEAKRLSYKCLGFVVGAGTVSTVIKAMEQAYADGAEVLSMSLGSEESQGGYKNDPECRVIRALTQQGLMVVVAAGNSGPNGNTINNPGLSPDAITVGAINPRTFEIADFSSRGPTIDALVKPDVVAPGVDIYSGCVALLDAVGDKVADRYSVLSGTSMATPHIAGFCALLKQKYPEITSELFKRVMKAHSAPKNNDYGYGMPNWEMFEVLGE